MRRSMRNLIVGASASLLIVGCGITATKKDEDKNNEDASGVKAGASVNNQQFSLSLPYLPDIKPGSVLKAHIRIFDSHVALPTPYVDCAVDSPSTGVPDKPTSSEEDMSSANSGPDAPQEQAVAQSDPKEGLGLTQRPAKAVYEDSLEYKVGASIGPIMLDPGTFTAILDVYDERGKRYSGTSWFDVKKGIVSKIDMRMVFVNDCGGNSGVVINPIVPGGPDNLISACQLMTMEAALCLRESATCYYNEFKAHSECGLTQARQQLIGTLCQKEVRVPKNFKESLVCDVSVMPPPPPTKPQPPTTKPQPEPPVIKKIKACIQLDMPCDAPANLPGVECIARYAPAGVVGNLQKTLSAQSANYCKNRHTVLTQLCKLGVDSYTLQCKN